MGPVDFFADGSCIAYYPFEDDLKDKSGNYPDVGYDTLSYATWGNGRKSANIGRLSASNINLPMPTSGSAFSVFNNYSLSQFTGMLFVTSASTYIGVNATGSSERWNIPGDSWPPTRTGSVQRGDQGSHIVFSFSSNIATVYVDTVPIISSSCGAISSLSTLGSGASGATMNYSELRVFNRSLTQQDVERLYISEFLTRSKSVVEISSLLSTMPAALTRGFR